MEIINGIEVRSLGLWIKKYKILVISDLHIGYEEALNKKGVLVPRHQFKETLELFKQLFEHVKPETVVLNGDLKHEFGEISGQEWRETLSVIDFLEKKCKKIILIKGNHDIILEPIARKRKIEIRRFFCIGDICILHGDKILLDSEVHKAKILIIGHEHPAVSLREGSKVEMYKCFLLGKWKGKKLIVMPSFLPSIEGTDIKREKLLSPYLKQNISGFEVFIVGDKIYRFGKFKKILKNF